MANHLHELIDFTAGVYVVHENKVLIRKHDKYGVWVHVGGHVELDEHPVEAAIREAKEEVGLDVAIPDYDGSKAIDTPSFERPGDFEERATPLPTPRHMNIHRINDSHQHLDLIFYGTSTTNDVIPENPEDTWRWLTKEEVENNSDMSDLTKRYALGALKELGS